ncbi:MAG: DUF512 domain-containing protein [Clostridiales bacterium]|nr:DUF512 domain-containing protein [Clostridiales bacterium]HBM81342.1 radical SAM protein [Clostridiaceae bacterium]
MKKGIMIKNVIKGGIADEVGIKKGDLLIGVNGKTIEDIIDYKYLIADEYLEISVLDQNRKELIFEVEKEYDDDLGIEFENPLLDNVRSCANKCIFCFIDQLPKGMRNTLYFKDDDSRLSFLQGNFITFTNLSDKDIQKIIEYKISPLNVSVHTTDPRLRIKMLRNKNAGNIMEILKKLTDNKIKINCQIVLCRDINDGNILRKTINDLYCLYPMVKNIAVVPVGITKYRQNLYNLRAYDEEASRNVLSIIDEEQEKIYKIAKTIFVRAADEFYIMAGRKLPEPEYYGDYEQLQDGIGMVTNLIENVKSSLKGQRTIYKNKTISVITGISAFKYINNICKMVENKIKGLKIHVYPVKNDFFGERITVAGLLTGRDIVRQLKGKPLGEKLIIPSNVFKSGENVLLDDMTLDELKISLNTDIDICGFDGSDFLRIICRE